MKPAIILLLALAAVFPCAAQQAQHKQRAYHILGIVEPDVYPLMNVQGLPIQWNAPTFEGFVVAGKTKKAPCIGAGTRYCYSYDGRGNWQFNLTGSLFCKNTCSYAATGELAVGDPMELPDGSEVRYLSAVLTGTWTDQNGVKYPNVLGYYSTTTAPSKGWSLYAIPVPAFGGITIILADN